LNARLWVEAARPKTLTAGLIPVLAGTAAATRFIAWRFAAAVVVALSLQVAVNFANDYFDGVKGVDRPERKGPRRLTAAGLATPAQMKIAIASALLVATAAGSLLAAAVDKRLVIAGGVCIAAALGYSAGPRPYGSAGLGEVMVFVFFGLVATTGSAFVQSGRITGLALAAAVPVGFLATALLVINNLRDIQTDTSSGKMTLAVKLGARRTRRLFNALVGGAYLSLPVVGSAGAGLAALLPLISLPVAGRVFLGSGDTELVDPMASLIATAKLDLVFGLLLTAGLLIGKLSGARSLG